ncbi:BolA family transcriptional regulator [Acetobacteraceae bacterium KSS8]|uniref:BolA family transcriptional regulator n=1 Tax=Endosaccharibacter trunci TaxID=2812733 RepID=A0ABT1W4M9_9PROT|nr:BolA family transcriptional regulator [Acetobacteraceae bacterium KSS8]
MSTPVSPAPATRLSRIEAVLAERFAPLRLVVEDDSARHAGHAGARGSETHFNVLVVSDAFSGLSRVQRSRAVHEALDAEFRSGLHALSLVLRTPAEPSGG